MLLLGLILGVGCGKKRRPPAVPPNGQTVKSIRFAGNGGLVSGRSDFSLRGAMEQQKNPPFVGLIKPRHRRVYLDPDELALDAWRLEIWYAHHGYFDARFMGWDIRGVRPKKRKVLGLWKLPRAVRLVGHVEEGRPYEVASIQWEGLKALGGPVEARLRNEASLKKGDVFDLDALNATVDETRAYLLDQSYAYVQVTPRVDVYPARDKTVDVVITVELGPSCTFGALTLSGLDRVPERIVRAEIPLRTADGDQKGEAYSESDLASTRRRLFGLQVFSVVNVSPVTEAPPKDPEARAAWEPDTVVPVRVDLAESSFRQMRLGTGVLLEGGRQEAHVSADFTHVNLFERLIQLDWANRVGYAIWLTQAELFEEGLSTLPDTRGPVVDSQVKLTFPHVPARGWRLVTDLRYELGVEQGYRYSSPSTSPALLWRATDRVDVELGYHLRFFDYIDLQIDPSDLGRDSPLGLDFSDPYLLGYYRQKVTFDSRDDILFARRGLYGSWELAEAGGPAGGQFNFLRLRADHRAYVPIIKLLGWRPSGALAFRVGGGVIQPYGGETKARVPYAERLYLGGASDVRGWQSNRLGPYICDVPEEVCGASDVLPIGGLVSLHSSAEVRLYTDLDLGFAVFTDAGMVWEDLESALPPILLPSVGAGGRYRLPFGVIRLDLARRIRLADEFPLEPLWNLHFGLAEAF